MKLSSFHLLGMAAVGLLLLLWSTLAPSGSSRAYIAGKPAAGSGASSDLEGALRKIASRDTTLFQLSKERERLSKAAEGWSDPLRQRRWLVLPPTVSEHLPKRAELPGCLVACRETLGSCDYRRHADLGSEGEQDEAADRLRQTQDSFRAAQCHGCQAATVDWVFDPIIVVIPEGMQLLKDLVVSCSKCQAARWEADRGFEGERGHAALRQWLSSEYQERMHAVAAAGHPSYTAAVLQELSVVDVGSDLGGHAADWDRIFKPRKMVLFEQNPAKLAGLESALPSDGRVVIVPADVGKGARKANSTLKLDEHISKASLRNIELINISPVASEGGALAVVRSLGRKLKDVGLLVFDCSDQQPLTETVEMLAKQEFAVFALGETGMLRMDGVYAGPHWDSYKPAGASCLAIRPTHPVYLPLMQRFRSCAA